MVRKQFRELRYIVGYSTFCTSDIANADAEQGIWFLTRIPDRNGEAATCIAEAAAHPEKLEPVDPEDPSSPRVMWSGNGMIGDQKIIKLTVRNEILKSRKRESVGKRARKELEELNKLITKLRTRPYAEKRVAELEEKLKFCVISNVQYEKIIGYDRRGHTSNGDKGRTKAVKAPPYPMSWSRRPRSVRPTT